MPFRRPGSKIAVTFISFVSAVLVVLFWPFRSHFAIVPPHPSPYPTSRTFWAQYSPYYSVAEYEPVPCNCEVIQVNIIQRHGARFPTETARLDIAYALQKLQSAQKYFDDRLLFLRDYEYNLGIGDLLPLGALESSMAGALQYERYSHLVDADRLPFVRTDSIVRVVESATNWSTGLSWASNRIYQPEPPLIIAEDLNNTLANNMCPNAKTNTAEADVWLSHFATAIVERLNDAAPGALLAGADILSLMSLCSFETLATSPIRPSPFCALFDDTEFEDYEYYHDLTKYYNYGYGQELGRVQGVGYVNELLARLTGQPVRDQTQTNRTLDSSPATFPLNRTIYADFSHDNTMVMIYAALGLFAQQRPLDPHAPEPRRTWFLSRMAPFGGRMVTEKIDCRTPTRGNAGMQATEYVRILVDDKVQPLEFCGAGADGMCGLDAFVESQSYARADGDGDFEKCFN
ncbi:phytase [Athelia psychrophila]|uniref:Phytase A n=1 Tax=Athelia psychrophila TaxID=1759441 RepID=A0A165YV33_9AGAM|nr:phytase [Fibularhizoctonia sp. CBS 109695]